MFFSSLLEALVLVIVSVGKRCIVTDSEIRSAMDSNLKGFYFNGRLALLSGIVQI